MLTGDEIMSGGEAILHGTSLRSNRSEYLSNIGYCPQFDSIIDVMTGIRRFFNFRVPSWFSHAQNFYFLEICLNLFVIWNFLSPLKIYLKFGTCAVVQYTDKGTDAWWDIFMIWKIDFGLLAVAWTGLWEKRFGPIMSNFWGRFFQLFVGKKN